jgi:hypothetical protein
LLTEYLIACLSVSNRLTLFARVISSILKIVGTRSSETSVYNKPTRRHIPEAGILHKKPVLVFLVVAWLTVPF